jgi:hypothetical protein
MKTKRKKKEKIERDKEQDIIEYCFSKSNTQKNIFESHTYLKEINIKKSISSYILIHICNKHTVFFNWLVVI